MTITRENTILLSDNNVTVRALEAILTVLRKHGSVYVEVVFPKHAGEVPTLAEVLYK